MGAFNQLCQFHSVVNQMAFKLFFFFGRYFYSIIVLCETSGKKKHILYETREWFFLYYVTSNAPYQFFIHFKKIFKEISFQN